jgi:hypothetical protein
MDPDADPDPAIFVIDLPKMPTKNYFKKVGVAYYFLKVLVHHFQKQKVKNKSQSSTVGIQIFLTFFFAW